MEVDDSLYQLLADICRPNTYGTYVGYQYTKAEVKILCIDAIMYYREHEGEDKIEINKFFESKGL